MQNFFTQLIRRPLLLGAALVVVALVTAWNVNTLTQSNLHDTRIQTTQAWEAPPGDFPREQPPHRDGRDGRDDREHRRHHGPPPHPPCVPPTVLFLIGGALGYLVGTRRRGCPPPYPHWHAGPPPLHRPE